MMKSLLQKTFDSLSVDTTKHVVLQYLLNNRYTTVNELVTYEPTISVDQFSDAIASLQKEGQIKQFSNRNYVSDGVWCLPSSEAIDLDAKRTTPKPKKAKQTDTISAVSIPIDPHSLDVIKVFAQERSISMTAAMSYLLGKAVDLLELVQEVQAMPDDNSRGV